VKFIGKGDDIPLSIEYRSGTHCISALKQPQVGARCVPAQHIGGLDRDAILANSRQLTHVLYKFRAAYMLEPIAEAIIELF
jgi:hypothetical protein